MFQWGGPLMMINDDRFVVDVPPAAQGSEIREPTIVARHGRRRRRSKRNMSQTEERQSTSTKSEHGMFRSIKNTIRFGAGARFAVSWAAAHLRNRVRSVQERDWGWFNEVAASREMIVAADRSVPSRSVNDRYFVLFRFGSRSTAEEELSSCVPYLPFLHPTPPSGSIRILQSRL